MKKRILVLIAVLAATVFAASSCSGAGSGSRAREELTREEADALVVEGVNELIARTVTKPWRGEDFVPGRLGGTWNSRIVADPKTFNSILANSDTPSRSILNMMRDYLLDYNVVTREWEPHAADYEIRVNEAAGTLSIVYTLRDDLYWSYYNSDRRVKVTSDDVIFWYELEGNPELQMSGYNQQFVIMQDGSTARIRLEKIDDRRFAFHFPRIVSDPELFTNTVISHRLDYEEAFRRGGAAAVQDIFNITIDPRTLPSMGQWFLVEYTPGQRLVYRRNPNYWKQDINGLSIPYFEEQVVRIIPDTNTSKLVFLQGDLETFTLRPEDLDEIISMAGNDYTVFNAEGSFSAPFWTFNQNPVNRNEPWYDWFTQKEFRQAMSCLINRDRIAAQVFRGLAEPKYDIFPEPNPFFNEDITLQYRYDPARAIALLDSIGIRQDSGGVMRDSLGRAIEFDLVFQTDSQVYTDTASILMDELSRVGIKINIRIIEFQRIVDMLTRSYEWSSVFMALGGSQIFPSQGSNVWPTTGNLHFWHPNQPVPATDWEARVDYLYNEGSYTIDHYRAKAYWDEFQEIILEQLPLIYLMRQRSFAALRNRWDMSNVYFDNRNGFEVSHIFLKQ